MLKFLETFGQFSFLAIVLCQKKTLWTPVRLLQGASLYPIHHVWWVSNWIFHLEIISKCFLPVRHFVWISSSSWFGWGGFTARFQHSQQWKTAYGGIVIGNLCRKKGAPSGSGGLDKWSEISTTTARTEHRQRAFTHYGFGLNLGSCGATQFLKRLWPLFS